MQSATGVAGRRPAKSAMRALTWSGEVGGGNRGQSCEDLDPLPPPHLAQPVMLAATLPGFTQRGARSVIHHTPPPTLAGRSQGRSAGGGRLPAKPDHYYRSIPGSLQTASLVRPRGKRRKSICGVATFRDSGSCASRNSNPPSASHRRRPLKWVLGSHSHSPGSGMRRRGALARYLVCRRSHLPTLGAVPLAGIAPRAVSDAMPTHSYRARLMDGLAACQQPCSVIYTNTNFNTLHRSFHTI